MSKKAEKTKTLRLTDERLATVRMDAINIASRLPEEQYMYGGLAQGPLKQPGKSAAKVIQDAEAIVAFVTKR